MRTTLFIAGLFFLINHTTAQNYYVATLKGDVYYQNKLLKKKDKVIPKGNIRFKSVDSYVKLSGPGGLYVLSAKMGRASGNEFLLTLSNELFPKIRLVTTAAPTFSIEFYPNVLNQWGFFGLYYSFLDKTKLAIDPAFTADGQMIYLLHETNQGLFYKKVKIQRNSALVLRTDDFATSADNSLKGTLVVQISNPAILDTIIAKHKTLKEVMEMPVFAKEENKSTNQILDILNVRQIINRRAFIKDMRFLAKSCDAKTQEEFLNTVDIKEYISENYGKVYMLEQVLSKDVGLPESN
ncbi:MAG: hypothetical protein SFU99_06030 [Saprospiraceae bacterium]|nr:hypothetical protein [Saprospiraceae bacterium]